MSSMPLLVAHVGRRTEPVRHAVDTRWLLAYSASVRATGPELMDTRRSEDIAGHPLFPVCVEWPLVLASQRLLAGDVTRTEVGRGVHATHDLVIHRLVRPGDTLSTRAEIASVEHRPQGAFQELLLETTDLSGTPVATTRMGVLFRGVATDAPSEPAEPVVDQAEAPGEPEDRGPEDPAEPAEPMSEHPLHIEAGLAHTYTECSRIWNPIHTDPVIAAAVGLPAIILHGTCTLALAISSLLGGGEGAGRVRRVRARFSGMVFMPSTLTLRSSDQGGRIRFEVAGPAGEPVLSDGLLDMGEALGSGGPAAAT